jgi:hypothetical protein
VLNAALRPQSLRASRISEPEADNSSIGRTEVMIVLAIPPGWTLHPGGAHIALPLLQGYLRQRGIDTRLYDMNIGSATHHRATITESSVRTACENLSASRMNEVYFNVEDRLGVINTLIAIWEIPKAYENTHVIRRHSLTISRKKSSPKSLVSIPRSWACRSTFLRRC